MVNRLLIIEDRPEKSPVCFVFGGVSHHLSDEAARLFKAGLCQYIFISGGKNRYLGQETEFDHHRQRLIRLGVPKGRILGEDRAGNTLENVKNSAPSLKEKFPNLDRLIVVCLFYHARRCLLTFRKNFSREVKYFFRPIPVANWPSDWWRAAEARRRIFGEIARIIRYTIKGDIGY